MNKEEQIIELIYNEYSIKGIEITPANRGFYGETWKLETKEETYFVKIDYLKNHQALYKNSLEVIDYLCQQGIDFINHLVKTKEGHLFTTFQNGILAVFEWIEAKNVETDETKADEYNLLSQIYKHSIPGFNIPIEDFSTNILLRFDKLIQLISSCDVRSVLENNQESIEKYKLRLIHLSCICQQHKVPLYLTHGDAGGNFMVGDTCYLVDFDEVKYAPLERDAWVMGCYPWARELFNDTLRKNGIEYTLSLERLAYYYYYMYFFYLCEMLESYRVDGNSKKVIEFFHESWLDERLAFAGTIVT